MNGEPIAIPIICASSDMLLVVPSANDVGVWSFVRIMTILQSQGALASARRKECNSRAASDVRECECANAREEKDEADHDPE